MQGAHSQAVEQTVITVSGYTTKGSGIAAVGSGLVQRSAENPDVIALADLGVVAGIIGVFGGLVISGIAHWVKNRRDKRFAIASDKREQELHEARLESIKKSFEVSK